MSAAPTPPAGAITARRLLALDRLLRQRAGGRGRPLLLAAAVAVLAAAAVESAARAGAADGRARFALVAALAAALIVLGGPFRLFWRRESALLCRIPVSGGALLAVAAAAGVRLAVLLGGALLPATLPLLRDGAGGALRAAAVAAVTLAAAAALAPAAAAAAGVLVSSPRARRAIAAMSGQGAAPPVVWLGLVPSLAAIAAGALPFLLGGTLARGELPPPAAVALVVFAAAALAAARLLVAHIPAAVAAVAALDRVRLAHVEAVGPTLVDRLAGHLGRVLELTHAKDVTVARRRYEGFYLLQSIGAAGLVLAALASSPLRERAGLVAAALLGVLSLLLAARLPVPPVELPRLLATLPIHPALPRRGKRVHAAARAVLPLLAAAPLVWRSPSLALLLGGVVAAVVVGSVLLAGRRAE